MCVVWVHLCLMSGDRFCPVRKLSHARLLGHLFIQQSIQWAWSLHGFSALCLLELPCRWEPMLLFSEEGGL